MQHAQNPYRISGNSVGGDIGRARNHQLSRSLNSTYSPDLGKLRQLRDGGADAIIDHFGRAWTFHLDVIEDCIAIGDRENRPFQEHGLVMFLLPGCGAAPGKMLFHLPMGNSGTGVG